MDKQIPGQYVQTPLGVSAFIPDVLPRHMTLSASMVRQFGSTSSQLGGVRALSLSPHYTSFQHLLIGPLLRREATASSRIEGTRTDLGQLLLFEATEQRTDQSGDAREVLNYVRALTLALNRPPERPLTLQLIRELHTLLMEGTRGDSISPGEFRRVQNWIGGPGGIEQARYVPPPPEQVLPLIEDVIRYVNDPPGEIPELVRIAMLHYQFEAIHPFEDGNGRLGRLIVVLLLAEWGLLPGPYLSISEAIEEHRSGYIDRLKAVSTHGDWEGWIRFFLAVVHEQAEREQRRVVNLMQLREEWRGYFQGSRSGAVLQIVDLAFERPIFTAKQAHEHLDYTYQAILNAIERLVESELLREMTGQRRNRVFVADEVLAIVSPAMDGA